jgi:plastocyanin
MYQEIIGSCMETRTIMILLICLVSAAVLVTGCTSQPSGSVTTISATTVPPPVTSQTSGTVIPTGTPDTIQTTGTPTTLKTGTPATPAEGPTASQTEDKGEIVRIKAKNFAFDVSRITVPAQARVIVEFENEDVAPHNVAFYTNPSLTATIYKGKIITGPGKITYVFTAPAKPGIYFFRCDVHPSMQGQFVVT